MGLKIATLKPKNNDPGFTIVELLVVIVVIGILAAIAIVSYAGITKKANESTLQSDLATAKKQFALYYTEHGVYPTGLNENKCPTGTTNPSPDTNYCLKSSSGDDIEISEADGSKYKLTAAKGTLVLTITDDSGLTPNDPDWVTIGTQKWARKNLNVGVMIDGSQYQTNNSLVEKNCYDNLESNCTKYGGLYQWREMMAYAPDIEAEGTKGICPVGSHVPTELEWKALFTYLGGIEIAGMKLSSSGGVGFDMMFGGMRFAGAGGFHDKDTYAYNWSSSHIVDVPWNSWQFVNYYSGQGAGTNLTEFAYDKSFALSVRCLKD